jgi:hypothetical protein
MGDRSKSLEHPDEIRDTHGERQDGRPTGGDGSADKPGVAHQDAPTVAPEEKGASPSTEHGPGGDL